MKKIEHHPSKNLFQKILTFQNALVCYQSSFNIITKRSHSDHLKIIHNITAILDSYQISNSAITYGKEINEEDFSTDLQNVTDLLDELITLTTSTHKEGVQVQNLLDNWLDLKKYFNENYQLDKATFNTKEKLAYKNKQTEKGRPRSGKFFVPEEELGLIRTLPRPETEKEGCASEESENIAIQPNR